MSDNQVIQFCQSHWELLIKEVKAMGLWHLVSQSGEELKKKMENRERDPLMGANLAICSRFAIDNNGHGCPICGVMKTGINPKRWIEEAVNNEISYLQ